MENKALTKSRSCRAVVFCATLCLTAFSQAADGPAQVEVSAETFGCIRDMAPVRGFYVAYLLGDLNATLAVANSAASMSSSSG